MITSIKVFPRANVNGPERVIRNHHICNLWGERVFLTPKRSVGTFFNIGRWRLSIHAKGVSAGPLGWKKAALNQRPLLALSCRRLGLKDSFERGEDIRSMMKLLLKTWRIKQQEADQHS